MLGLPLPIPITRTKKCERCTMRYKRKLEQCPHCTHIADGPMLEEHIQNHKDKLRANAQLGTLFIGISIALLVLILALANF